jgi:hypothetical protein
MKVIQNVLVLKKINSDFPEDDYLKKEQSENKNEKTRSVNIFNKICNIIYEYKHQM